MNHDSTGNRSLFAATTAFFFGFSAVAVFSPMAFRFSELMFLSPTELGLLIAAPSLSGSLLRIPFSAWVDTTGGRKPFLILLSLSIIGMAGLVILTTFYMDGELTRELYPVVLIIGLLCGCGIATFSVGASQVSYWFPQSRQGHTLGIYAGIGNLAPGIFSLLLPMMLIRWDAVTAYSSWLLMLILSVIIYYRTGKNAPYFQLISQGATNEQAVHLAKKSGQQLFPANNAMQALRISAANQKTWLLVALYFTSFGGFIALTAWLPIYWQQLHGVSLVTAGALTALFATIASLIRVYGGLIADRFGGEKTAVVALLLMFLASSTVAFAYELYLSIIGISLIALSMGIINAAVFKLVPKEIPESIGGAVGWVGGLGAFGGFIIPLLIALPIQFNGDNPTSYAIGFSIFAVLALSSLFTMLWQFYRERFKSVGVIAFALLRRPY